jgi:hypothetical protein
MNSQNNAQLSRLAEALFRFSAGLDESLAPHVRQVAVELAGAVAAFDEAGIERALGRAQGVVGLGKQVGIIAESDAEVIAAAISRSKTIAVPKPAKQIANVSVAEFAGIAQEAMEEKRVEAAKPAAAQQAVREAVVVAIPAIERREVAAVAAPVAREALAVAPSAVDRHEQIVNAIRRNPNARMRDLLAALPGVSERTIRYDLERLVASGKIEREGVGGPATWYRVRASVTTR